MSKLARLLKNDPFVIAEAGVNHNGKLSLALRLVDAAAKAGADAVKFQTFRADALAAAGAPKARYQKSSARKGETQLQMLRKLELGPVEHHKIAAHCRRRKILFLSTPFDADSADLLEKMGMPLFKVPSGEITNHALLTYIARKRRPMIVSTGMSTLAEVRAAVSVIRRAGNREIALLHCVSSYPADARDVNLRAMATMSRAFGLPVGYSDHTLGIEISVAAAALGAKIIEKHFTLDKTAPGPDHAMSLDPAELATMIASIRRVAAALGDGVKAPRPCEAEISRAARRSLVLARAVPGGTTLTRSLLAAKRPGTGIPPSQLKAVLGRKLKRAAAADTVLRREMLS